MSYVFLAGERVYKLKKPVRFTFLDFSTVPARAADCREELRLNRRLAPGVYLDVIPLTLAPSGDLALRGEGAVVDWLVEMRRLPERLMLDRLIVEGRLETGQIAALAETLASFYACAERTTMTPAEYVARFFREHEETRRVLTLCEPSSPALLDRLHAMLAAFTPTLEQRVRAGRVIDGHGDLRPEHICFTDPIAIFDCLEFNHDLRQVDPFDELAFLDLECALLGAGDLGPRLLEATSARLGDAPAPALVALYGACRAMLRARLALAHLFDPHPRQKEKWAPLAARYLQLAATRMAAIG
ncbi:hypothetical protein Ms3S1_23740 [Methylosinus sp. 3S-1]|uniref:Aminoglycoside phosphotransferase domain-containing protein n=2 Tax=Methylocystaceae TaxID=31993 RepID=A0A2D2D5R4_METT3|nr:hypothetical protein CQW49_12040 [Methylosinus trichosporium OB3b]